MSALKYFCLFEITFILCYIFFDFKSALDDFTCEHCKFGYLVEISNELREKLNRETFSKTYICENCGKIQE